MFSTWDLRCCVYPNLVIESVTVEPGGLGRGTEPPLETGNRSPTVEGFNPSSPVMMQLTPKLPLTPPPRISCRSLAITRARSSAPPPFAPPPTPPGPLASLLFCSISQFPYILLSSPPLHRPPEIILRWQIAAPTETAPGGGSGATVSLL